MNNFKPSIFIGSSKEGLHIAERVKSQLADVGDCKLWTEAFVLGKSAYEDLVTNLSLYDYGILIATQDDKSWSRKKMFATARDNVVFEFGLFAGRLGRDRAILMAEVGVKIPSDLGGITLATFPERNPKQSVNSKAYSKSEQVIRVEARCREIVTHIKNHEKVFNFGFLPSTALAYGYFNNFLRKVVDKLVDARSLHLAEPSPGAKKDIPFDDFELTILIPDNLRSDMFDQVKQHRHANGWKLMKFSTKNFRPFDFYIQMDVNKQGKIFLSDIPITLNALNEAIRTYSGRSFLGASEAEILLERREIRTFKDVLQFLVSENPLTKHRVKIQMVSI